MSIDIDYDNPWMYDGKPFISDYIQDNFGYEADKRLNLIVGLGYRFGSPAKTSYDGIKNITTVPLKP